MLQFVVFNIFCWWHPPPPLPLPKQVSGIGGQCGNNNIKMKCNKTGTMRLLFFLKRPLSAYISMVRNVQTQWTQIGIEKNTVFYSQSPLLCCFFIIIFNLHWKQTEKAISISESKLKNRKKYLNLSSSTRIVLFYFNLHLFLQNVYVFFSRHSVQY